MHYYEVAPARVFRADGATLTYSFEDTLAAGQVVTVEVGNKPIAGVVMGEVPAPEFATKPISAILEEPPLPQQLIDLSHWLSDYYLTPLGLVWASLLPGGVNKTRRKTNPDDTATIDKRTKIVLNTEQRRAVETLGGMKFGSSILRGITGSGKTRVYLELARQTLAGGRSVIILVPEIALTSQIIEEFAAHFDNLLLTHSRQSEAKRHLTWRQALRSSGPRIVIGPRSALFQPLSSVGLIVIDEAHEPGFKQDKAPRYSALRAAAMLSRYHGAKLVMGSATPSVAEYYIAESTAQPIVRLSHKARANVTDPEISLVDMKRRQNFKRHRFLSDDLLDKLEETFALDRQALIYHNRRGSASTTLCDNCGWTATCPKCFLPMTLHADAHVLRCHLCGLATNVPTACPVCFNASIIHKGIGTKLIETELQKLFPDREIARFDGDNAIHEALENRYDELKSGNINLIIGTQVVAKGLDLPNLRTVGVVQADAGLSLPDYSADERTFQLLAQVVGRVGRSPQPTNVVIQTYQPEHPAIVAGLRQDYDDFYHAAIGARKRGRFPPFSYLLKLTCVYKTESAAVTHARDLAAKIRHADIENIEVLGPTPAFYERQYHTYRWQLVVKSPERHNLIQAASLVPVSNWQVELDPISLL